MATILITLVQLLLVWICTHFILFYLNRSKINPKRLPPGPLPYPILGNLFNLGIAPHRSLSELSRKYGSIFSFRIGFSTTVVISSPSVARQVLQKDDVLFSHRGVIDSMKVFNHPEHSVVLLPPQARWRYLRRLCSTQIFANSRLDASRGLRRKKVEQVLCHVKDCAEIGKAINIGQVAFSTILNFLSNTFFSIDLADPSSESVGEFKQLVWDIMYLTGQPNLSDFFPLLRFVDPQGIKARMTVLYAKLFKIFDKLIDKRMEARKAPGYVQKDDVLDALLSLILEDDTGFKLIDLPHLLLDLFVAGTETTSSTSEWAMAELLHNPHVLKKAQAELNEVIGRGNPVEEEDALRLPYLQAVVKETFRKHPPVPFLVPRKMEKDASLCGYNIPKNAQIFINVWAIGRDPKLWPNPEAFDPERFVGSQIDFKGSDFELVPFGAGRRICPALPLAHRMLHWLLASLIHSFNWKLEDGAGTPETMDMQDRFGFTVQKAQPLRAIPLSL